MSRPYEPLPTGIVSVRDQAAARGEPVPVGRTVGELRAMGYVVYIGWADGWVLREDPDSPTGYVLRRPWNDQSDALYFLAH